MFHSTTEENRQHDGRDHKPLPALGEGTEFCIQRGVVGAEVDHLVRDGYCRGCCGVARRFLTNLLVAVAVLLHCEYQEDI